MDRKAGLIDLEGWLGAVGLAQASLEPQGDLLIINLPPALRDRLLKDSTLRRDLVQQAKGLGFSRLALDL